MTTKKTKKQTPQAVLELIARLEREMAGSKASTKRYCELWMERGQMLEKALVENENYKKQFFDQAKEVEGYKAHYKAKLDEAEQQVGKLLADAKRARDEQRRDCVYIVAYQPISGGPLYTAGVYETEEDAKKSINASHQKIKWVTAARAQLHSVVHENNSYVLGEYLISERRVQKSQP